MKKASVIVVGHYCHDSFFSPGNPETERSTRLGGSAAYISLAFSNLGLSCKVLSKVGADFKFYEEVRYLPQVSLAAPTTHFIEGISPSDGSETFRKVDAVCDAISIHDLYQAQGGKDADYEIALGVGIADEVHPEILKYLRKKSRYLICDAQGLLRKVDFKTGRVFLQPFEQTRYYSLVNEISFLKASEEEARFLDLDKVRKSTCILLTQGPRGCTVIDQNSEVHIPAFQASELDPTGAGDCFVAGFSLGLKNGMSVFDAVKLGNQLGAQAVQEMGVPKRLSLSL